MEKLYRKLLIKIKDGFLETNTRYHRADRTAFIVLEVLENTVTLSEVADAIIQCTFFCGGTDEIIDRNRFSNLNITVKITTSESSTVTYNFKIPNYKSTSDVLPAIAENIRI